MVAVKKFLLAFALSLCALPAIAAPGTELWLPSASDYVSGTNPLPVTLSGSAPVTQAQITSLTASVPNASTTVTLTHASTHLIIKTDPSAAILYVNLTNGTATTANFRIDPGAGLSLDNMPSITAFKILGASATGTYSVAAW